MYNNDDFIKTDTHTCDICNKKNHTNDWHIGGSWLDDEIGWTRIIIDSRLAYLCGRCCSKYISGKVRDYFLKSNSTQIIQKKKNNTLLLSIKGKLFKISLCLKIVYSMFNQKNKVFPHLLCLAILH